MLRLLSLYNCQVYVIQSSRRFSIHRRSKLDRSPFFFFLSNTSTCQLLDKPCVTGVVPSSPRFLPSIFIAHRVQQSHCSSIFHGVLHSHAVALSASQFVRKKKSPRIYASMHSGGLELTKLTCTRLEDNLINHRGDRQYLKPCTPL